MGLNLALLFTAKAYVWTGWAIEPVGLRLHPEAYARLARSEEVLLTRTHANPDWVGGLAVTIDRYLPPVVWRLTAADGSLLYDSRQGRKGNQW